jgi:hypothetical protein
MSTKVTNTLNTQARSAIVASFCNALDTAENTGSLVTQVCNTAHKFLHGAEITKDDSDNIVADIARARGWKDAVLRTRSSEVRTVLSSYTQLSEAIEAYTARAHKCDWHTGIKLARRLKSGDSIKQAVANAFAKSTQSAKSTPQGRTAGALKAWFKDARSDKRTAILKAAEILGLKLGVHVDA